MLSKYLKHSFSNFTVRSLTSSTILYSKLLHTFRFRYTRLQIHFLSVVVSVRLMVSINLLSKVKSLFGATVQ